jgi:hypothetical protein
MYVCFMFMVLARNEAQSLIGKCSTTELHSSPPENLFWIMKPEDISHYIILIL